MYKATGDSYYLGKANEFWQNKDVGELSWDEKTAGAAILLAQLTGDDKYVSKAVSFCNKMADTQQKTPKGMVWIQQWGPLRHASNVAFACLEAAKIADSRVDKEKYYQFAVNQIHYALGDTGRSFVVGYGTNPPQRPHHRSSSCPTNPSEDCGWDDYNQSGPNPSILWGALVGGPGADDSYTDYRGDYIKNEVACDYNAGFQSALAGLKTLSLDGSLPGQSEGTCSSTISTTESQSTTDSTTVQTTSISQSTTSSSSSTTSSGSTTEKPSSGSCIGITKYNYDEVIEVSNLFYQAQRSGPLDVYGDFNHQKIPYRGDSCLTDGSDNGVDLTGGYFDGE